MNLPLKTRLLEYAMDRNASFTVEEAKIDLAEEYKGEKQFNAKRIEEYLDSFLGINFMEAKNIEFDSNNNIVIHYQITEYGESRRKYIQK